LNTTYESYLDPDKPLTIGDGEPITCQIKGAKIKRYATGAEMLQDLALGDGIRLDGILNSGYVFEDAIDKGLPLKTAGDPVFYEPLSAACDKARPGSKELIKRISAIFASMQEAGILTVLSVKWYGVDLTKKVR
jgi:polar amino acid transport system substrate-binding protein